MPKSSIESQSLALCHRLLLPLPPCLTAAVAPLVAAAAAAALSSTRFGIDPRGCGRRWGPQGQLASIFFGEESLKKTHGHRRGAESKKRVIYQSGIGKD
jgi:hypothetical protein